MLGQQLTVTEFAHQLGIDTCFEFSTVMLVPEERIRGFCFENRCGNYGSNYMCPPYIGLLEDLDHKLKNYHRGLLLQYTRYLDVKVEREAVKQTRIDFHHKILRLEDWLRERGINEFWSLIGGSCALCETCGAKIGKLCLYPEQARTSLEAIGVDVLALLNGLGMDNAFYNDKITWTGCILLT
jgi:predicted metal-binding protein